MKVKEVWVRGDLTLSAEGGNAHNLMMMARAIGEPANVLEQLAEVCTPKWSLTLLFPHSGM